MRSFEVSQHSLEDIVGALSPVVGSYVSVTTLEGYVSSGELSKIGKKHIVINGKKMSLDKIRSIGVLGKADWTTQHGHRGVVRAAKLNIRATFAAKQSLVTAAAKSGMTLTEFVLESALDRAATVLGES